MPEVKRAENLIQAFRNFRPDPLRTPEEFRAFHVDRNLRVMRQLYKDIEASDEGMKFLVVGYRGSGKSTELRKLQWEIQNTGEFLPVSLDIEQDLKYAINDLEIPELLAYMSLKLIEVAEDNRIKVDKEFKDQFEKIILKPIETVMKKESIDARLGISVLRAGGEVVKTYRKEFKTKSIQIINLIDALIQHLENKLKKPLLLLIDGTDKMRLEKAEQLFSKEIQYLVMPRVRMVVLCPVAIARSRGLGVTVTTYFGRVYEIAQMAVWKNTVNFTKMNYETIVQEIIEVVSKHNLEEMLASEAAFESHGLGKYLEYKGFKFYYDVTKKRMDLSLIEPEALTMLIIGTGKLSEFMAATQNAISIARADEDDKVKLPHVKSSLLETRTVYEDSLSLDDKRLLIDVHGKKEILQRDREFERSISLLYYNHIVRIHAKEDKFWDDVDPLYYPELRKWKESVS